MADLMFPLIFILLLYIIVEETEGIYQLILYMFLFVPIAFIFNDMINTNAFDKLFTATIPYQTNTLSLMTMAMWFLPLFTIASIFDRNYKVKKERREREEEMRRMEANNNAIL